jgi:hypothetical protein
LRWSAGEHRRMPCLTDRHRSFHHRRVRNWVPQPKSRPNSQRERTTRKPDEKGQITIALPVGQFALPPALDSELSAPPSRPSEGRWPSSRTLGWDAVDAVACVTNALLRTTKSCGPDAPTLASSSWEANASWG